MTVAITLQHGGDSMNPYEILGLTEDATREQIESAYKAKRKHYEPYAGRDVAAVKKIDAAFEKLISTIENDSANCNNEPQVEKATKPADAGSCTERSPKQEVNSSAANFHPAEGGLVFAAGKWWLGGGWGYLWAFVVYALIAGGVEAISYFRGSKARTATDKVWNRAGCMILLVLLTTWARREPTSYPCPELDTHASIKEISEAYAPYFYFVGADFTRYSSGVLGQARQSDGAAGSGILLVHDDEAGLILTNRHVIDPAYAARLSGVRGNRFSDLRITAKKRGDELAESAQVVAIHKEHDLALLLVEEDFDGRGAVKLAPPYIVDIGSAVVSLGNPQNLGYRARDGKISNEPEDFIEHTCQIDPGFSGGPLLLKDRGLLAGINTLAVGRGGNYAISVEPALRGIMRESEESSRKPTRSDWTWRTVLLKPEHRPRALGLLSKIPVAGDE